MLDPSLIQVTNAALTKEAINESEKFLALVFKPGVEELGLMLKDQVRRWRLNNIISILKKAQGKLEWSGQDLQLTANARVGFSIFNDGSVVDDDELQNMWAGLFVSSCTKEGKDDNNLVFVNILRQLSSFEAKILKYACENSTKYITESGFVISDSLKIPLAKIMEVGGVTNVAVIDSSFDHMVSLRLFSNGLFESGGFAVDDPSLTADIGPSTLALNLYYKIYAPIGVSVADFWGDELRDYEVFKEKKEQQEKQWIDEMWKD